MNWKHIEAVMKDSPGFHAATLEGQTIITDGFIAMLYDPALGWGDVEINDYELVLKLWADQLTNIGELVPKGGLFENGSGWVRKMGTEWLDEAFFRCFDGPDTLWHLAVRPFGRDKKHRFVLAVIGGRLVAICAPCVLIARGNLKSSAAIQAVPDERIFAPYADASNGFYLNSVSQLNDKILEAEGDIDDLEFQIADKRKLIDTLTARRNALSVKDPA